MKKFLSLCLSVFVAAGPLQAAGADPYEELAAKLSTMASRKLTEKKIAVLTFEYVDGRTSPGGRTVAEKLTNRFVELGEFTVIERGMVEKVMKELEFQNSGGVDSEAAKKLGKGLGVEAIVTGTLSDAPYGSVEVNARVIKTESYEIVAAASMKAKKSWSDAPATSAAAEPGYSAPVAMGRRSGSGSRPKGFLDLMLGGSTGTMDFETDTPFGSGSATGLTTTGSGVFGMRVGGFGEILGGDIGFSVFNHGTSQQTVTINGLTSPGAVLPEDFLHVNTFEMSGDLLMRFPTGDKVIPYFGLGMGLSINNVTSNSNNFWLIMNDGTRLNQTVMGFLFRVPFGVRVQVADSLAIFTEGRIWMNKFEFDQGIVGINNIVTQNGFQFLGGVGLTF